MPGFFGSKLGRESRFHWFGNDLVWLDPFNIARGGLGKLKWDPDDTRIKPVGAFHISYALMRLKLRAAGIDARYLPYDWRKSAALNADILMPVLQRAGNVSLLTHSQGGRVARVLAERDAGADLIRRIITIAPPHHGLYQPVRTLAVAEDFSLLNLLDWLDHTRSARDLVRDVTNDLPGLIEMMPLIDKRPGENFYDPDWWPAGAEIPPHEVFQAALAGARALPDPDARFVTIAAAPGISTRRRTRPLTVPTGPSRTPWATGPSPST
jgi:pimeloyl-ACP methyl ester carboxylesterase